MSSSGNFDLAQYWRRQIPILLYHSVDETGSIISISPSDFRANIQYLAEHGYESISLHQYLEHLRSPERPKQKMVVITFDDGFKNNYEMAFPILQEFGVTATVFVVTDLVGKVCRWGTGEGFPETPLMTWQDIEDMQRHGMDMQPHSCTHPCLKTLSKDQIVDEVLRSKQTIEKRLGNRADVFCYPFGMFDDRAIRALKETGYVAGVTTVYGRNNTIRDPFRLRRIGTGHFPSQFRFRLGLYPWYDLCVQIRGILRRY